MDGSGARAASEASEWLPEEWPGAGEGQEAERGAAIAREEGGAHSCPHTALPLHASSFPFVGLQHKNLTLLFREDRLGDTRVRKRERGGDVGTVLSHCHRKNTTILKLPCTHTEPERREKETAITLRTRGEHCVLNDIKY